MSQILNKLRDVDPNNSEAVKEALSPFFQQLPKHTDVDCIRWLRALKSAINRFPKHCMSQRANIETYLKSFLDCTNYYVVIEAAKCAHVLQQVRPSQEKTATAKSCWRDLLDILCNTAHKLITALFPNAVDIYEHKVIKDTQETPSSPLTTALLSLNTPTVRTPNNVLNKQMLLNTRLRNVFVFIQAMLVEIYPVAKPIRPQLPLDVIVRALSLSSSSKGSQNLSDVVMVKTQALTCLDALVVCLGSNLIPFSPLVFRFVMQTLKWSSENPSEEARKVRCAAYASLKRWLTTLHTHKLAQDRGRNWEDDLTEHIIGDITPHKHVVELKMNSQPTKHLSKKAKRKLANTMLQESSISTHMPGEKNKVSMSDETNDEVAIAALECAAIFLLVCGIFLKPSTHKRFQERLVRECLSTLDGSPVSPRTLPLLEALDAARKLAVPTVPPPTQYCLQIYSNMLNVTDCQIANFCSRALLDIRLHLHCSPPSLNFAIEVNEEVSRKEEKKKISEKNRAALEALLGADKVPKQNGHEEEEEVITIPDEPNNKRRKVDETDKIEISDDSDTDNEDVEVIIEDIEHAAAENVEEAVIEPIIEEVESIADVDGRSEGDIHDKDTQEDNIDVDTEKETVTVELNNEVINNENEIVNEEVSEDKVDSTQPENPKTIYDEPTQMPVNTSHDEEDETPLSMEVAYDYPNTGTEKIAVLEKLEGDNLPSTNETDDIEITCGQDLKDTPAEKKVEEKTLEVKVNGIDNSIEKPLQNGDVSESVNPKEINVEDMLADFVDEVNEDTQNTQLAAEG